MINLKQNDSYFLQGNDFDELLGKLLNDNNEKALQILINLKRDDNSHFLQVNAFYELLGKLLNDNDEKALQVLINLKQNDSYFLQGNDFDELLGKLLNDNNRDALQVLINLKRDDNSHFLQVNAFYELLCDDMKVLESLTYLQSAEIADETQNQHIVLYMSILTKYLNNINEDKQKQAIRLILEKGSSNAINTLTECNIQRDHETAALIWYLSKIDEDEQKQAIKLILEKGDSNAINTVARLYSSFINADILDTVYTRLINDKDIAVLQALINLKKEDKTYLVVNNTLEACIDSHNNNIQALINLKRNDKYFIDQNKLKQTIKLILEKGDSNVINRFSLSEPLKWYLSNINEDEQKQAIKLILEKGDSNAINALTECNIQHDHETAALIWYLSNINEDEQKQAIKLILEKGNSNAINALTECNIQHDHKTAALIWYLSNINEDKQKQAIRLILEKGSSNAINTLTECNIQRDHETAALIWYLSKIDEDEQKQAIKLILEKCDSNAINTVARLYSSFINADILDTVYTRLTDDEEIAVLQALINLKKEDKTYLMVDHVLKETILGRTTINIHELINLKRDDAYLIDDNLAKTTILQNLSNNNNAEVLRELISLKRDDAYLIDDNLAKTTILQNLSNNNNAEVLRELISLKRDDAYSNSSSSDFLDFTSMVNNKISDKSIVTTLNRALNSVQKNGTLQNILAQSSNISSLVTTQEISIDIIQQIFQKLITEDSNITTLNELSNVIRTLIRLKDDKEYIISQQCIEKVLQEFWDQNSSFENGLIILHDLKRLNIDDTTKWEYIIEKKVIERIFNSACDNSLMRVVDALLLEQRKDDKLGKDQFIISNDIIKTRFCSLLELEDHNNEIIKRLIDVRRDSYYVIDNDYIQEVVINSEQISQTLIYLERDESYIIDDVIYPILELCLSQGNQSILQQLINLMRDDDYIIDQNMIKDIFIKLLTGSNNDSSITKLLNLTKKDNSISITITESVPEEIFSVNNYIINEYIIQYVFMQLLTGSNDPVIQKLITLTRDNDYLIQDDSFKKYLINIIQDNKEIRLIEPLINLKRKDEYLIKEDTIVNIFKAVSMINAMHKVTEVLISAKRINDHLIKENTINEAFKKASLGNMYETVKMFICAKREDTSIIQDDVKKDALQDAATKGHVLIVEELINNSTNEFLKEFLPQALVCAASNNRIEVIRLINDHDANYIDYSTKKRAGQVAFASGYRELAKKEFDYDSDNSPPLKKLKNIRGSSNPVDTGMSEDSIKDNMQMLQCTEIYFIDESDLINTTVLLKDNILAILKVQNQNNNHAVVFFKYGDNVSIIDPLDIKSEFSDSFIKLKHNLLNLGIKTIDIVYSGLQQPDSGVCADISLILVKNLADKLQDIQSVQDVISIIQDVRIEMYGKVSEKNQEKIIVKSFDAITFRIDGLKRLSSIQDEEKQQDNYANSEFVATLQLQQDDVFIKPAELIGSIL